jgi:hypothetical protein
MGVIPSGFHAITCASCLPTKARSLLPSPSTSLAASPRPQSVHGRICPSEKGPVTQPDRGRMIWWPLSPLGPPYSTPTRPLLPVP